MKSKELPPIDLFGKYRKSKRFMQYYHEEMAMIDLAIKLTELRKKKRLSQAQLAKKIHMPQSQISRIESGDSDVRIGTLSRVAAALDKKLQLA